MLSYCRAVKRFILLSLVLTTLVSSAPVSRAENDLQAWQWLTVDLYKADNWKAYLYADNRIGDDLSKSFLQILSPRLRYYAHKNLDLQVGYAYLNIDPLSAADDFWQHRAEFEVDPKFSTGNWSFHSRNRFELRWNDGEGKPRPRIRNRIQAKYKLGDGFFKHIYVNDEIFWNPDTGVFIENRLVPFGLGLKLTDKTTLNLFYMWQHIDRPVERFNAHVIGTFLQTGF
jgi:hypothetical protein